MPPSPDRPASACWVFRVTHAKWRDMLTLEANGKFSQGRPGPRRKKKPSHRAGTWDVKWKGRAPHWRGSVLTLTWAVSTMRTMDMHACMPPVSIHSWLLLVHSSSASACPPGPTPVLANQLPACVPNEMRVGASTQGVHGLPGLPPESVKTTDGGQHWEGIGGYKFDCELIEGVLPLRVDDLTGLGFRQPYYMGARNGIFF